MDFTVHFVANNLLTGIVHLQAVEENFLPTKVPTARITNGWRVDIIYNLRTAYFLISYIYTLAVNVTGEDY